MVTNRQYTVYVTEHNQTDLILVGHIGRCDLPMF